MRGSEPRERRPLRRAACATKPPRRSSDDVGLGVELVAVEDDELRVDAAPAQRLHVRPRHARRCSPGSGRRVSGSSQDRCRRRRAARAGAPSRRSASSACVSPIVAPSYAQISGWTRIWSHGKPPPRSSSCGQPERQCWFESGAVRRRVEARLRRRRSIAPGIVARHVLGTRVVPGDDRVEALVELDVRVHGVQADARGRARAAARSQRRPRSSRGCRRPTRSSRQVRRRDVVLSLELGHPERGVEREVDVVAQEDVARARDARRSVANR